MKDRQDVIYDAIIDECKRLQQVNAFQGNGTALATRLAEMVEMHLRRASATVELHDVPPHGFITVHAATEANRQEAKAVIQKSVPDGVAVYGLPADTKVHAHAMPTYGLVVLSGPISMETFEHFKQELRAYVDVIKAAHHVQVTPMVIAMRDGIDLTLLSDDDLATIGLRRR